MKRRRILLFRSTTLSGRSPLLRSLLGVSDSPLCKATNRCRFLLIEMKTETLREAAE